LPLSRKQLPALSIQMQIWEDHNFKVPLDVIDSELDKFFSSSNLRNLKEVDTWLIAFQEFYVPKLKKKLK
jgi:hypothetical protein